MNTTDITGWVFVAVSFGLLALACYSFGSYCSQATARLKITKREVRACLTKWGVEGDVYWPANAVRFVGRGILHALGVCVTSAISLIASVVIAEGFDTSALLAGAPFFDAGNLIITIRIGLYSLWVGYCLQYFRANKALNKVVALTALRPIFHQRFTAPEILSIYESCLPAPKLFWEAYINLPENDINEETNRKFRELVAPYRYSQSRSHNQYVSIATAIIICLTAISVFVGILAWQSG